MYGNCLASDRKVLQRVVCTAQYITGADLPAIQYLYTRRCQRKASVTVWQAVQMNQVRNQQDPEQLLPPSHKTAKYTEQKY
jgi:GAF domain-containing protein